MELVLSLVLTVFTLFGAVSAEVKAAGDYIWWEGEDAYDTNFPTSSAFSPSTFIDTADRLSGGDWLSNSGPRMKGEDEAYAKYRVNVPSEGEYSLWTRKFWKHGPFRWRFDNGPWQICPSDVALADDTYLKQYVGANWVHLGRPKLTKGKHSFELRLLAKAGEDKVAAFDAFLLAKQPFMPQGKLKPGQRWNTADDGFFPYEPGIDPFKSDALLDLRYLNERTAGQDGFVRREGDRFVLGNGRPVRFWAVNVSSENAGQSHESVDYLARKLAKLGVNMVRFHSPLFDGSGDPAAINKGALDNLFYLISAMKRQGIYTYVSFYFPLWFDVKKGYGIEGYDKLNNKKSFALLPIDSRMQQIYRLWLRQILTTKNPYTGLTLAAEPSLAMVELVNEDSYFFWTFTRANVPDVQWQKLEVSFGRWLTTRYGSLDKAFEAWGKIKHKDDDLTLGRAGLYEAWDMTRDGSRSGGSAKTRRIGDQVRFLTEHQREFYASAIKYIRGELGAKSLINCSNWTVTDGSMLDALERYTYTAGDVIDRHGYFGGKHEGEGADYSIRVGHGFESLSGVTQPEALPLQFFQMADYPQIISEIGWTNPNRYKADFTFLSSAYSALQGIDGLFFFAVGSNFVADQSIGKFQVCTPVVAGSFPAAALQYRLGYVKEAGDAVHQVLKLDDLYAMKGSGTSTASALDELRKKDIPQGQEATGAVNKLDPLSFYVGRVVREFGEDPGQSTQKDLPNYIDRKDKVVRSLTGELNWDYGKGLATVDTPYSKGVAGFLGRAGKVQLSGLAIESENEYGSIMLVSLDGKPLESSKKILIQAATEEQPYGFSTEGKTITSLGSAPFEVKKIDATVSIEMADDGPIKVVPLDYNGYSMGKSLTTTGGKAGKPLTFKLDKNAIYHVILR